MKRLMFAAAASVAVFAFVPASALAQHHGRHHKRHHHHAHIRRFGDLTTPGSPGSPTTAPTQAGQVTDFSKPPMLVITLTDGRVLKGDVTSDTEIECTSASDQSGSMQNNDQGPGGDQGGSGSGDQGGGEQGSGDDDQGNNSDSCGTAALTMGAPVAGAELEITSSGNVWNKIVLITSSTSSSSSGEDGGGSDS